jgi:transcriptional regulator with XRE-family HTH domain
VTAYTDSTGRKWHGCASVADVEAYVAQERREQLGAAIRARREALGVSLRQTARALRRSPGWLSDVETARGGWSRLSPSTLDEVVGLLGVDGATHDLWHSLAGYVEPGLLRALLSAPERWGDVRAVLARGTK